jgi:hypothetical protein
MNFKKENGSIKLESIMDNGTELDIAEYSEPLLSIGDDGKYTRTSIEPSDTKASGNNEVNSNTQEDNQALSDTRNESGELTPQEVESSNTEQKTPNNANTLDEACKDLELQPGCEKDNTYKSAFKKLALKYHTDRCKTPDCEPMMKKINAANDKLNNYNSKERVPENNEASNQQENTKPLEIEKSKPSVSSVSSIENNLQENKSKLPTNIPVTLENNNLQVALRTGGKTKRRKAGKKNKSKRVRFMSKRNRRR